MVGTPAAHPASRYHHESAEIIQRYVHGVTGKLSSVGTFAHQLPGCFPARSAPDRQIPFPYRDVPLLRPII